jgi:hypothetical protein
MFNFKGTFNNLLQNINLLWITTIVSIIMSTFRAMNFGYQMQAYVISALCNMIFIHNAFKTKDGRLTIMYAFHLITSFIAINRWYVSS